MVTSDKGNQVPVDEMTLLVARSAYDKIKNNQAVPEASALLVEQIQSANPEALKTLSDMNAKAAEMVTLRISKKEDPKGKTPKDDKSRVPSNDELSSAQQSSNILGSGSHAMMSFHTPNDSKNPSKDNKHERGEVTNEEGSGPFSKDHTDKVRAKAYTKYSRIAPEKLAQSRPHKFPRALYKYFMMDGDHKFKLTDIGSPMINHTQFKLERDGDPSERLVLNSACDPDCWWFIFFCRKNSRANYFKANLANSCFIQYELACNTELTEDDQMLISHTSKEWKVLAAVYRKDKKDKDKKDKKEDKKDKKEDKTDTKKNRNKRNKTANAAIAEQLAELNDDEIKAKAIADTKAKMKYEQAAITAREEVEAERKAKADADGDSYTPLTTPTGN
jgi:hypothetical protein